MRAVSLTLLSATLALAACSSDGQSFGGEVVVFGLQQGPAASAGSREIVGSFELQRFRGRGPARLHVRSETARECFSTTYGDTPPFTEPGRAAFTGPVLPGGELVLSGGDAVRAEGLGWRGGERVGFSTSGFGLPPARGSVRLPAAAVRVLEPPGDGPLTLDRARPLRVTWDPLDDDVRITLRAPAAGGTTTAVTCFYGGRGGAGEIAVELLGRLPPLGSEARLVVASHAQIAGAPAGFITYVVAESLLVERRLAPEGAPPDADAGDGG